MAKKGEKLIKTYNKIFLYIFVTVISSMALTQNYLIKPVLRNIQIEEDLKNIMKIRSVVTSKLDFINGIVRDNSEWEVMAKAIEEKDIEFMASGYDESFLKSIGGNYLSLHDKKLKMLYDTSLEDVDENNINKIKKVVLNYYNKRTPSLSGITCLEEKYYYYSLGKITDESGSGDLEGVFLLVKKMDDAFIEEISKELGNKIELDYKNYELKLLEEIEIEETTKKIYYLKSFGGKNEYLLRYNYEDLGIDDVIDFKITLDNNNKEYVEMFNYRVKSMMAIFFVVIIILNYILKKNIIDPISNLSIKMNRFLNRQDDYLVIAEEKEDEISILMNNYNTLIRMIAEREKSLKDILYVDSLTGVGTRRLLDERLEEYFNSAKEKDEIAMAMIDIDCFKRYNDNYGHQKGDEVLKSFGKILLDTFDMEKDLIIRYGGEEFVVVSKPDGIEEFGNKIIELKEKIKKEYIEHNYSLAEEKIISFSCGVVKGVPKADETSQTFIKRADEKLYTAKAKGRNKVVF